MDSWYAEHAPGDGEIAVTLVALEYARQHLSDAVRVQEVLDAARYRQSVESTGELLLGVEVQPEQETFRVMFGKTKE
jgi:hypothetical protein